MQKSRSISKKGELVRRTIAEASLDGRSAARALARCLNRVQSASSRFPNLSAAVKRDEAVDEAFDAMLVKNEEPFDDETFLYMRHLAGIEGGITLRELDFEGSLPIRSRR